MTRLKEFLHRNPVRVAAFVTATVTLAVAFVFPNMDPAPFVLIVTTMLGLGEYAQRKENTKTADALAVAPPLE